MPRRRNIQTVIGYPEMGADGFAVTPLLLARANLRERLSGMWRKEQEMIRKHFRFKRFVLGLALGLVFAVVAAPTALSKPVSSDTLNGGLDPWAVNLVYKSTHPSTTQAVDVGPLDPWAVSLVYKSTHPSTTQAVDLGPLDPWAYSLVYQSKYIGSATPIRVSNPSTGFDFTDAGIGAAVSFGIAVILLGMVAVGVRHRRMNRSGLATS